MPHSPSSPPPGGQSLVYQAEDGKLKLEVRFEGETVWLTQQHMADLFQTTQQNISLHLQNIYAEGELECGATHKEYLSVRMEGAPTRWHKPRLNWNTTSSKQFLLPKTARLILLLSRR